LIAFPSEILGMIYGQNYASGGIALMVLSVGMFVRAMSTVHGTLLASRRIVSVEIGAAILAMAVNVTLNWILIPSYGMAGAAFASAASFLAVSGLLVYYSKKIANFGFNAEFLRPINAGFVALIVLVIAKDQVLSMTENVSTLIPEGTDVGGMILQKLAKLIIFGALFLLACIIYGLILLITKGFGKQDFELLSAALKKSKVPEAWLENVQNRFGGEYV